MEYVRTALGVPAQANPLGQLPNNHPTRLHTTNTNLDPITSLPPDDLSHQLSPAALWSSRQGIPPVSNAAGRPGNAGTPAAPKHMTQQAARQLLAQYGDLGQAGLPKSMVGPGYPGEAGVLHLLLEPVAQH